MIDEPAAAARYDQPLGEREGLRPLREHRTFIVVFILSAVISALAYTYVYSERYRADATIFFKPSDVTEVSHHEQEALGAKLPIATQKNITQTINQLATSDPVLRRVVLDLHLEVPKPHDTSGPWYQHYYLVLKYEIEDFADVAWKILKYGAIINDPIGGAMYKLNKSIKITNDDSYVYTVAVSTDSLEAAVRQANKLVAVLAELLGRDERLAFEHRRAELVQLRDQKAREIEDLDAAMRVLLAGNGVASIDDELKSLTDSLSKLVQERTDARADLDQSEGKVAAASEKLRVAVPAAAIDANSAPAAHASRISPDDYAKLMTNRIADEVASRGERAKFAAFDRAYTELAPRIPLLTGVKAQEVLLAAELSSAKRDYAALTDGIAELSIRQTTGGSELHVQAPPNGSLQPVSPIKVYHVGAAAGLAVLVAIGLAYVLDYFEIRLFLPPAGGRSRRRRQPVPEGAREPSGARGVAV